MRRRRKSAQYATVLKFMQILAQKGLLTRDGTDRAHVYAPVHSREMIQQQRAGDLLQRGVECSMKNFMIGALSARKPRKKSSPNFANCSTIMKRGNDDAHPDLD